MDATLDRDTMREKMVSGQTNDMRLEAQNERKGLNLQYLTKSHRCRAHCMLLPSTLNLASGEGT